MRKCILLILTLVFSSGVGACDFPEYMVLTPSMPWEKRNVTGKLEKPVAKYEIHRGTRRENGDSCADIGVLTLTIRASRYIQTRTGYLIEILESTEDQLVVPDYPVMAEGVESTYSFPWLDGATAVQEPIKVVLRITQMNTDGRKSEPTIIEVSHRGYL